jgi:hypothetical protein
VQNTEVTHQREEKVQAQEECVVTYINNDNYSVDKHRDEHFAGQPYQKIIAIQEINSIYLQNVQVH